MSTMTTRPEEHMTTKNKDKVKAALASQPAVARWALRKVYANQSDAEQTCGEAMELNGLGFTKVDSEFLTSLAQFFEVRGFLTARQMAVVHRRLPKYWRQVASSLSQSEIDGLQAGVVPEAKAPDSSVAHVAPGGWW